jgi:L-alanine-DL-glutamate epimerase-like enolase superfamily enzyme
MTLWERLAALPLRIDDYALQGLQRDVSSAFTRRSTVIRLRGAGHEGVGEDVTYDAPDHEALQAAGAVLPLAGDWTLGSFSQHLGRLDLWPAPPSRPASVQYRLWAYESAALDLALRQAGTALPEALGREPRPVTFVVSLRLGEPPTMAPIRVRLDRYPTLRFKLDPTSDWSDELIAELVATGAVDSVDLKGLYEGSIVDQGADPDLYRRVAEAFPDAWIEDPKLTPETDEVLRAHRDRITWDANIHAVADIEALPFPPRMVNIKPSRFGPLHELLAAYEYCEAHGIGMYGGGQFELGPGRGHIQALASLFHPDGPNDTAPGGFNDAEPPDGLPSSPLPVAFDELGFRWGDWAERPRQVT